MLVNYKTLHEKEVYYYSSLKVLSPNFASDTKRVEFLIIQRLFKTKVGDDLIVNMNRFAGTCGFPNVY